MRNLAIRLPALILAALIATLVAATARPPAPLRTPSSTPGRTFYVAPYGRPDNRGSVEAPLDLATALSAASPVLPGDTVWVRGGLYLGAFRSALTGTKDAPIVVRAVPGEHAILDASGLKDDALHVAGGWTWYWGFEIRSSHPLRESREPQAADIMRGAGVVAHAPGARFINLIVHDMLNGLAVWKSSPDAEVYGSLIYHNGYNAADRGHGHGIYAQNEDGAQRYTDNIVFGGFAHGIHAYGSDRAFLNNLQFEGNVVFNSGVLAGQYQRNILVGGGRRAENPILRENYTYYGPDTRGGENNVGYLAGCRGLVAENNYFAHARQYPLVIRAGCDGVVRGNTIIGAVNEETRARFPENTYLDAPSGVEVFTRPNRYEAGRAHIVVYNWDQHPRVNVSLDAVGLRAGEPYHVRDAQHFFGPPVAAGVYMPRQTVSIPMDRLEIERPTGKVAFAPAHTSREFGVFVVMPGPGSDSKSPRSGQ